MADKPLPPDENLGPALVAVSIAFGVPSLVTTVGRLYVRHSYHYLAWDDHTMTATTILTILLSCLNIAGVSWGKGRHDVFLSTEEEAQINKLSWIAQIVLFSGLCLLKTSICLLILRIRSTPKLRWFLGIIIAGLVLTNLECIIILAAQCKPTSAFWRPKTGVCWDAKIRIYSIYVQASYSVFTDLLCSLLPIVVVWNVRISVRKKFAVCGLMGMGLLATALAAVRASSLAAKPVDITYMYTITSIYACCELNLGIIAANLAPMRTLLIKIFRRVFSIPDPSQSNSNNRYYNRSGGVGHSDSNGIGRSKERKSAYDIGMTTLGGDGGDGCSEVELGTGSGWKNPSLSAMDSGREGSVAATSEKSDKSISEGIMKTTEVAWREEGFCDGGAARGGRTEGVAF